MEKTDRRWEVSTYCSIWVCFSFHKGKNRFLLFSLSAAGGSNVVPRQTPTHQSVWIHVFFLSRSPFSPSILGHNNICYIYWHGAVALTFCAPQYWMFAIKELEVKVIVLLWSHLNVENVSVLLVVVLVGSFYVTLACLSSKEWVWKRSFVHCFQRVLQQINEPRIAGFQKAPVWIKLHLNNKTI